MKNLLPEDELTPTHTPLGVDPARQAEYLRELRALENQGRQAEFDRNDFIVARALSNSLSRPDMARAIGVSRSRIDQIIRSHHQLLQDRRNAAAANLNARRAPNSRLG